MIKKQEKVIKLYYTEWLLKVDEICYFRTINDYNKT